MELVDSTREGGLLIASCEDECGHSELRRLAVVIASVVIASVASCEDECALDITSFAPTTETHLCTRVLTTYQSRRLER